MLGRSFRDEAELAHDPLAPFVHDLVDGWNHEECEKGRRDDAADHRSPKWSAELRSFTTSECNWNHSRDQRERRHENRTQTNRTRLNQGFTPRQTILLTRPFREVDKKNCVLRYDSHQQNESDETHDVDRVSRDHQREHHADE